MDLTHARSSVIGALNGWHFSTDGLETAFEKGVRVGSRDRAGANRTILGPRDFAVPDPSGNLVRTDQWVSVLS